MIYVVDRCNIDVEKTAIWIFLPAIQYKRSQPGPFPAVRYLEGDFVLYADWLGLAALGVYSLLIAAAIGTAEDDGLAALGGLHLLLRDELAALLADAFQQRARGFVCGVLGHELALHRYLQHGLAQAAGQRGIHLLAGVLELSVFFDERHELVDALDDAARGGTGTSIALIIETLMCFTPVPIFAAR